MHMQATNKEQPAITIHFSPQSDGYTFRLRPKSLLWLEANHPNKHRVDSVFIGYDNRNRVQYLDSSMWEQIVQLLTGLSTVEINQFGGFTVVHPVTQQEIYNSLLVHA